MPEHAAADVAACWLGGARAVAEPLYRGAADDHALAHLGSVVAALTAAGAVPADAAARYDGDPFDRDGQAELVARRTRAVVEHAVDEVLICTGRALGAGPLCQDSRHARRVADLTVYVRQGSRRLRSRRTRATGVVMSNCPSICGGTAGRWRNSGT